MQETPEITEMLNRVRQPAIWLRRCLRSDVNSRLGGLPSLPEEMEWPIRKDMQTPLHFLAQIDLSEMPSTPLQPGGPSLPKSGVLMFFADLDEELIWDDDPFSITRVVYSKTLGPARALPPDLPEIFHPLGEQTGEYGDGMNAFPAAPLEAFVIDSYSGFPLSCNAPEQTASEWRMHAQIEQITGTSIPEIGHRDPVRAVDLPIAVSVYGTEKEVSIRRHFMLGAASDVQNAAEEARQKGLVSLFQIDTDWGVSKHFIFCDMGMAQFWISKEDLASERFQYAWATTEGG